MTALVLTVLVRSLVLGALGLIAERLLARRPAALRHAITVATLAAMLLSTVASFVPDHTALPAVTTKLPVATAQPAPIVAPDGPWIVSAADGPVHLPFWFRLLRVSGRIWLDGAAALLALLLARLLLLGLWVRRASRIADGDLAVPVFVSERVRVPMTGWWGRHLVLAPPDWTNWDLDRRRTVIAHEQAHIRRRDWLTNLAAHLCCIVVWPNPLAWILLRRSRDLAEQAADDLVLDAGFAPSDYAGQLLAIAKDLKRSAFPLTLPMAAQPITRRIEMILKQRRQRAAVTGSLLVLVAVSGLAAAVATGRWSLVPGNTSPTAVVRQFVDDLNAGQFQEAAKLVEGGRPDSKAIPAMRSAGNLHIELLSNELLRTEGGYAEVQVSAKITVGKDTYQKEETFAVVQVGDEFRIEPSKMPAGMGLEQIAHLLNAPDSELGQDGMKAESMVALSDLKQAALATIMLADDNGDRFSTKNVTWVSDVMPYLKTKATLVCPPDKPGTISFSFNDRLRGAKMEDIAAPASTILIYEGKNGKLNFRHGGRAGIALADGHAQLITKQELSNFVWGADDKSNVIRPQR